MVKNIFTIFILLSSIFSTAQKDVEIQAIMAKGCASPSKEPYNEMTRFRVGNQSLQVSSIFVETSKLSSTRPPFVWNSMHSVGNHKTTIDAMNLQIDPTSCGKFVEPTSGILPANASVLLLGSYLFEVDKWQYGRLNEPVYVLFHDKSNGIPHFKNPTATDDIVRRLIIHFGNIANADTVDYKPNGWSLNGKSEQSGARIEFKKDGTPNYLNDGCALPIEDPFVEFLNITAKPNLVNSNCGEDTICLFGNSSLAKYKKWKILDGDPNGYFLNGLDSVNNVKFITKSPSKTLSFELEIKDECFVSTADEETIELDSLYEIDEATIIAKDSTCIDETINLSLISNGTSVKWSSPTNIILNPNLKNGASIKPLNNLPLKIMVTTYSRCMYYDSLKSEKNIGVLPASSQPIIFINYQNICLGDQTTLYAINANNPVWSEADAVSRQTNQDSLRVKPTQTSTTYSVYNHPTNQCKSDTAQITITTHSIPSDSPVILPIDTAICLTDTITLYATKTDNPTWNTNDIISGRNDLDSIRVSPTQLNTTYSLYNNPDATCKSNPTNKTISTYSVVANKPSIIDVPPGSICLGDTITLYAINTDNPTWNTPDLITGATNLDSIRITPKPTDTIYSIFNNPPFECESDTAASKLKIDNIVEAHIPIITPLLLDTICLGDTITLFATNTDNPTWSEIDIITGNANLDSIRVSPTLLDANYSVYNSPAKACKSEIDSINVTVKEVCIPSSISFNGINLKVLKKYPPIFLQASYDENKKVSINTFDIANYHLIIFDRWGSIVFETTEDTKNWDATNKKGKLVNSGTYFYIVTGVGIHDYVNHIYKGYIPVIGR